jgi:hypothetical protein
MTWLRDGREDQDAMNNRMDGQRQRQRDQLGLIQAQVQQYLDTTELSLALGGSKSL